MKRFSIQIKNPCEENRDNMLPTELGKFCMSCQKEVIDFTKMSDAEIISFLNKSKSKCGAFKLSQLNRNLNPISSSKSRWHYFFASILSLNFLSGEASANIKSNWQKDSSIMLKDTILLQTDTFCIEQDSINESLLTIDTNSKPTIKINEILINEYFVLGNFSPAPQEKILNTNYWENYLKSTGIFFSYKFKNLNLINRFPLAFFYQLTKSDRKEQNQNSIIENKFDKEFTSSKKLVFNVKKKWFEWI